MIVLEFSGDQIRVAVVTGANGKARIEHSLAETLPSELSKSTASELGTWLKQRLVAGGFRAGEVVCVLGRGWVTLKALPVPVVPDNELPAVVHFAVEGATHEVGSIVVDYHPGPIQAGSGEQADEQEVLAAVISTDMLDALRVLLSGAGLSVRRILARPFAVRTALPSIAIDDDESVGIVYVSSDTLEVSLWTGEHLRICRWVSTGSSSSVERMANEVVRTVAVFHSGASLSDLKRIVIVGEGAESLLPPLRAGLTAEVQISPVDAPIDFFSLLGAGSTVASKSSWPIDLARPKRAKAAGVRVTSRLVLAGVLAGVLVVGGGYTLVNAFWSRDARIQSLQDELARLGQSITTIAPPEKRYAATKRWVDSADPILDELQEIAGALPDTSEMFITSLEYRAGVDPQPGALRLDGLAKSQPVITGAQEQLARQSKGRWKVAPDDFAPTGDIADFDWQWGVELTMEQPLSTSAYMDRRPERQKSLEGIDPGQGQQRNDIRLTKKTGPGPSQRGGSRSGRPRTSSSSSSDTESDSSKFFDEKVESIRKLPQEQWEEAIQQEPRFMQKRLRKALEAKDKP